MNEADYVGVDTLLGFCICKSDDLEDLCDLECRTAQRQRITFHCPENQEDSFLRIKSNDGSVLVRLSMIQNVNNDLTVALIQHSSVLYDNGFIVSCSIEASLVKI